MQLQLWVRGPSVPSADCSEPLGHRLSQIARIYGVPVVDTSMYIRDEA